MKVLKRFTNLSLLLQLSFLAMIVTATVLVSFGWYRYEQQAVILETELQRNLEIKTHTLASSLTPSMFNYDIATIETISNSFLNNQEVVYLGIFEQDGQSFFNFTKNEQGQIFESKPFNKSSEHLLYTEEIIVKDMKIGKITIGVTRKYLNNVLSFTLRTIVIQIIVLEFSLVIPLIFLLRYQFITPIQQLTKISSSMAKGDLNQPIFSYGNNEIGELAKTFFKMKNNIKIKIEDLNKEVFDRKLAEKETWRLQNYLSNIIDSMPSMLIGVDEDEVVTQWNQKAEISSGISREDAVGNKVSDVFPRLNYKINRILEAIEKRKIISDTKQIYENNNETHYEDITIYPLITNGIEGAVIRIDEVTERVRMEETMVQSEKMLSVGGLAAGMAHEINNPLAGMMQTANNMANRLGGQVGIKANRRAAESAGTTMDTITKFMEYRGIPRMLSTIKESGQRISAIVDNMLSFSRKSDLVISSYNIAELMDKTIELAATDYDLKTQYDFKTIGITKEYQDSLPLIPCEKAKIQQVFLNILRNGAQAMLKKENLKPKFKISIQLDKFKKNICVEIEDNGPGMDESTRKRVFEPFFTTKPVGVGTGLGLSVSYFIITENLKGTMLVKSTPDNGANFVIYLPIAERTV